ncbi:MAG TPA: hypothetical protein VMG10_32835 [Gemmataceae bacterium]|nr:hypothetical protein [Gemmataceae bacterium]
MHIPKEERRRLKEQITESIVRALRPWMTYAHDLELQRDLLEYQLFFAKWKLSLQKRRPVDPARDAELMRLHDAGMSYAQIARRPGCDLTREGVRSAVRRARRRKTRVVR